MDPSHLCRQQPAQQQAGSEQVIGVESNANAEALEQAAQQAIIGIKHLEKKWFLSSTTSSSSDGFGSLSTVWGRKQT